MEPRFARRTGGATITVTGENFGLTGSEPIVRISGRQCQKTYFPASTYLNNLDSHGMPMAVSAMANNLDSTGVATYTTKGFLSAGSSIGNPAGNALVNAYNAATDSFKSVYPEHWSELTPCFLLTFILLCKSCHCLRQGPIRAARCDGCS